jgi:hypothetical protein
MVNGSKEAFNARHRTLLLQVDVGLSLPAGAPSRRASAQQRRKSRTIVP